MTEREAKRFYDSAVWKHKRDQILKRDHYECQECRRRINDAVKAGTVIDGPDRRIRRAVMVHHIQELRDHPDLALDDDNLTSVCHECHDRIHGRDADGLSKYRYTARKKQVTEEKW